MSTLDKLIERLRRNPSNVRFEQLTKVLQAAGYEEVRVRGSHHRFRDGLGRTITVVRPHGTRTHCHPWDVEAVLRLLEQDT